MLTTFRLTQTFTEFLWIVSGNSHFRKGLGITVNIKMHMISHADVLSKEANQIKANVSIVGFNEIIN